VNENLEMRICAIAAEDGGHIYYNAAMKQINAWFDDNGKNEFIKARNQVLFFRSAHRPNYRRRKNRPESLDKR
jgi:hypothetical protein